MDIKQKTAAIATLANVVLTVVKFVIYAYTGSLAILSEAWHSLSDIATSFLVWLALRRKGRGATAGPGEKQPTPEGTTTARGRWERIRGALPRICPEELASFAIGLILLGVSYKLFSSILYARHEPLTNTLPAGVLFFVFGLSSYMVFKFETQIGIEQESVGLTSDGLHSKSDMIASFLAGGSLVAYHFGFDVDRPVGFFIALLIFFLAVEVFAMIIANRFSTGESADQGPAPLEFRTRKILLSLFDPDILSQGRAWLENRLHVQFEAIPGLGFISRNGFRLILLAAVLGYLSTAIVVIGPATQGLIERFGALQTAGGPLGPGIHWTLPWPFDTVHLIETETVQSIDVGMTVAPGEKAFIWAREHGDVQPFLAGDNNVLYPYLTVLFRIHDPVRFLNLHAQPVDLLQRVCLRTMTETIAGKALYSVFTEGRKEIMERLTVRLQEALDQLETGIRILDVCLKDVHPPIVVASDYEAVVSAGQTKQTMILDAFSHRNSEIPNVRGKSENLVQGADVYRINREYQARGEGARFHMTETSFQQTRGITRQRLYLEAMQAALRTTRIILIDRKAGTPTLFVNSGRISPFESGAGEPPGMGEITNGPLPDGLQSFQEGGPEGGASLPPLNGQEPAAEDQLPTLEEAMQFGTAPSEDLEALEALADREGDE